MKPLLFVFSAAKRYRGFLFLGLVGMFGLVGLDLLVPLVVRRLVSAVRTGAAQDAAALALVTRLALLVLVIYVVRMVFRFLQSYMTHKAGWGVVSDMRRAVYEHVQRQSLRFYDNSQTGTLMSRIVNDSDMFERLIAHALPDTLVNVLMLVGVSAILLRLNPTLMLLTLIPIPGIIIAMRIFSKIVRPAFRRRQSELAAMNATLNDNLSGIREIKLFTREETESERVGDHIDRYRLSMLGALRLSAIFHPLVEFAASLGTLVVIYFGGIFAFRQTLSIEDLIAFFLYLEMFYRPVRMLTNAWENMQEALAGADRVAELLHEEPEVYDNPGGISLSSPVHGALSFRNVGFSYIEGEPVLEDINLEIPAKTRVALVGPTGVGKTTLASLIPRFYDVGEGGILLDGIDIRDLHLTDLRSRISIVLQDVFLFHGTAGDNIVFSKPGATEADMVEAAKIANAHSFIEDLPRGYDTIIGERGVKLSGGQKQRLAIARAVLKNAPVLILDEATSSVDTETEYLIQQALKRLMEGRTTITIAHRLSTVRSADLIVVLKEGRIVEQGTHEVLIENNYLYSSLHDMQVSVQA